MNKGYLSLLVLFSIVLVLGGVLYLTASDEQQAAPRIENPFTSSDFVLIEAGSFFMGSDDSLAYPDEQPVHQVTISQPFYMSKTEVTQAQWTAIMGKNPSLFIGESRPVDNIGPPDIQAFLRALNAATDCASCYRLPTEAEWEYAARAGSKARFSFGADLDSLAFYAWYAKNAEYKTHPVAQKKPNAWGLYDMHGNVYEWVQDLYGPYPSSPTTDPTGSEDGNEYILRGGSWTDAERELRVTYRDYYAPNHRHNFFGFRLVRQEGADN
ncbi:MAG: formylglycine-generating enzyme family protein [Rhodothermaceae bacterium]|nr:formylglycine-generating enzyme family protein [Rhodothermaceae bacterium]